MRSFPTIPRAASIGLISLIGSTLAFLNISLGFEGQTVAGVVFGGMIPLLISLGIIGTAVYAWWAQWRAVSTSVLLGWLLIGVFSMVFFGVGIVENSILEGTPVANQLHILVLFPTYGTVLSSLIARYDLLQRTRNRSLVKTSDFMERIEEIAGIGGFELDLQSGYVTYTEGAGKIRGLDSLQMHIDEVIATYHEDDQERLRTAVIDCRDDGIPFDVEGRITVGNGQDRWVRIRGERVKKHGDVHVRGVLQDITLEKEREQRIMVLNRILRHNIRNDLTIIEGNAEFLGDKLANLDSLPQSELNDQSLVEAIGELSKVSDNLMQDLTQFRSTFEEIDSVDMGGLAERARTIEDTSEGMLTIAEKTRRFEKVLETDMAAGAVDIQPIIQDVIATYRSKYPDITVTLTLEDARTVGTKVAIEFIIGELVENAIVHNSVDGLQITVAAETVGGQAVVTVKDNGSGIPDMERQVLENGGESSLLHGSGIGLWTVNWLANRLGGRVTVGEAEKGACVELNLPSAEAVAEEVTKEEEKPDQTLGTNVDNSYAEDTEPEGRMDQ